jgi:hypothetical protein
LSSVYMLVFVGYQLLELTYPTIQGTTQCAARSVRHAVCGTQCAARSAYPQSKYGDQFHASLMRLETAFHNAVGGYTAYRCWTERTHSLFCCWAYLRCLSRHANQSLFGINGWQCNVF